MANYSYSTPYAGMAGGPLPPGFLEAATASGRNIARGIEQAGAGIASAIAQYRQNKEQDQFVTAKIEGLLAPYTQQSGGVNPETGLPLGLEKAVGIGGEKTVKKFIEGKASRMDKLALAASLETYGAKQLEEQQIKLNQARLAEIENAKKQQDILSQTLSRPITRDVPEKIQLPRYLPTSPIPVGVEEYTRYKQVPLEGDEAKAELKRRVAQAGGDAKTIADALTLYEAGRTPQIGVKDLGAGVAVVTENGSVKDVVKTGPDAAAVAKAQQDALERTIPGTNWTAPTKEEAIKFRESHGNVIQGKALIGELLELANVDGKSLSPSLRAKGEVLARQLGAAIRTDILGPGAITDTERAILEGIAVNPAKMWKLDSTSKTTLETLGSTLESKLKSTAKALGFDTGEASEGATQPQKFTFGFSPSKKKLVLEK